MGQEIVYCFRCQTRLVSSDFDRGEAYRAGDHSACARCAMEMLPTASPAVQQEILEQKRKRAETREKKASSPKLVAQPRGPTGSSTQVRQPSPVGSPSKAPMAVLAGIAVTLVLLVGMLVMSTSSSTPPPAPAPVVNHPPPPPPPGPSPREVAAQNAFQFALSYAKDHSTELDEQAKLFEKIVADYDKTPACAEAKRELERIARKRKEDAAAELIGLLGRARELGVGEEYQKAIDHLEAARKNHGEPEWTRPIDDRIKELGDAMALKFPALRDRAVEARKRDGAAEIHEVRAQLAKWNCPRYVEDLDKALAQVFPPVAAKPDGTLQLAVATATLQGPRQIRRTPAPWVVTQGWTNDKDYLEWTALPRKAGTYTIKLNYACPKEMKGSFFGGEFAIVVAGGETKTFTVEHTATWGEFKTFTFGTIALPGSAVVVSLRPVKIIGNLMSLRYLEFVPEK